MYCVQCATPLVERLLETEDRPRLVCDNCGYIHYYNPKVVAGTFPIWNGQVWLLRRGIEPRVGYWSHPAGYQEVGESTEEGAVRETLEEMGLPVRLSGLLGVYSRAIAPVVNIVYLAELIDPDSRPHTTPEALEVAAFTPETIPWAHIAFPSTAAALRDWVAGRLLGEGPVS
ncbi:MAG TPA: NUDIX hydrolase [Chloroflexia bacterium]|nr:NUDIX hydrolase [Chloroflexia bacterium]